jgi:hypothetical protein
VYVSACRLAEQAVKGGEFAQARHLLVRDVVCYREDVLACEGPLFQEVCAGVSSCCMLQLKYQVPCGCCGFCTV